MKDLKLRIHLKHKSDGRDCTIHNNPFDTKNGIAFFPIDREEWEVLSSDLYTGRKDKDNTDVYEGDILIYQNLTWEYEVAWSDNGMFALRADNQEKGMMCEYDIENFELVGNIHQETGKDWREMSNDEIECMVDEWHEADTRLSVYEYIGMTREEYYKWIKGEI